ncbi:MAG: domain S-box [Rhodocyclaceae bacterium]|nr:domain S-box [Rhodocyclaceae bacterium]
MPFLSPLLSRLARVGHPAPRLHGRGRPPIERRRHERRREDADLRSRDSRLRAIARTAAGFGVYDHDYRTGEHYWSPELKAMAGLAADTPVSFATFRELLHPEDRERVQAKLSASQDPAGSGLFEDQYRLVCPGGGVRWVKDMGRTFFAGEGSGRRALGSSGVVMDITGQKRSEEALRYMNEELERQVRIRTAELVASKEALERSNRDLSFRNQELQEFAYAAAHDLQTPLRSIAGFARLLQHEYEGRLAPQADAWITLIVDNVRHMHSLIQSVLDYSRVESRGEPFAPVDLGRLADEVLAGMAALIGKAGAEVSRGALPVVTGDAGQLAQVLGHLIENGIKYHGDDPPRVQVSATRGAAEWVIAVRDNGIGIPAKQHERIFEVFRRLHTQRTYPGTGIGLALCRRIVRRHGGRIWVESAPGAGSTFFFTLPDGHRATP